MLTVIDEFTRRCLAIVVARKFRSDAAGRPPAEGQVVLVVICRYGRAQSISADRSDSEVTIGNSKAEGSWPLR